MGGWVVARRFDRAGAIRVPFLSAMAMMGTKDGERGSYPEGRSINPHRSVKT
jgi:hypothetical protein